ncbi:Short-chain dehydrogenase/reductase SDR [Pleurostoma richardsiae]|uniref:Short-chain dehydrogenase/reductase SDR n=1 Tax=Pleurostoma richardsiae TaxID=41990 RepID=A0AA38R199_9PEZI|nr:Short-chain dehydrogenase/reductase SDR [Pleurostoma richardsiae]
MAAQQTPPSPQQNLAGKVALVSGSSSGIGAAIARELSSRGANIIINYPFPSEEASARAVLQSLKTSSHSILAEADLATLEGPKKLAAVAAESFGKVDILVNNAGYSSLCDLSEASDAEIQQSWDRTVNLNGRGTLLLTHAVLPKLAPVGSRIINIGSSTSRDPDPHMSVYAGSKGMVESFTRCWARDLPRKYGCTVNAVGPGPVGTEGLLAAQGEFLNILQARQQHTPITARYARPEEIAWVVAALCDEGASWVNGAFIPVNGGGTFW